MERNSKERLGLGAGLRVLVQDSQSPGVLPHPEPGVEEANEEKKIGKGKMKKKQKQNLVPSCYLIQTNLSKQIISRIIFLEGASLS